MWGVSQSIMGFFANQSAQSRALKTLLKSGGELTVRDFTALRVAIGSGDTDLMELLFINGVDVKMLGRDSCSSVMHLAFAFGKVDAIAYLVERGGDINSKHPFGGHTPVYDLVKNNYVSSDIKRQVVVKHLCRIDFDAPHSEGNRMLSYVESSCPELAEVIERFLAGEGAQLQELAATAEEPGAADDEPPAKRARIDGGAEGEPGVVMTGEGALDQSISDID